MTLFVANDGKAVFPGNVIQVLVAGVQMLYPDVNVVARRLGVAELQQSVGIFPMDRKPDEASYEMGNALVGYPAPSHSSQPTVVRYGIGAQCVVKDSDRDSGTYTHMALTNAVIDALYNDSSIAVGLRTLEVTKPNGSKEKPQRRGVVRTRYLDGQIGQSFVYLSTIEFWLETETK